jgi:periplasmic protein TonB
VPAAIAIGLHLGLLFGFTERPSEPFPIGPPVEPIRLSDITMPPAEPEPAEAATGGGKEENGGGAFVPGLPETPAPAGDRIMFPITRFTPHPAIESETRMSIPRMTAGDGTGDGSGVGFANVATTDLLDFPPRTRYQPAPDYPPGRRDVYAHVVVGLLVGRDGVVTNAWIVESSDVAFNTPSLEAVRRWRFEPGTRHGRPVAFRMEQPFTFTPAH